MRNAQLFMSYAISRLPVYWPLYHYYLIKLVPVVEGGIITKRLLFYLHCDLFLPASVIRRKNDFHLGLTTWSAGACLTNILVKMRIKQKNVQIEACDTSSSLNYIYFHRVVRHQARRSSR